MKLNAAISATILASSAFASTPEILQRDDQNYDFDLSSACPNGIETVYTTVTSTIWPDETGAPTDWSASPTGSDGQWSDNSGSGGAYTTPAPGSSYGSGSWSDGSGSDGSYEAGGSPSMGSGNYGSDGGSWPSGDNPLKPSVVPSATYGPWVVVNGDVHDYSGQGSGPWKAPGDYSGSNNDGSGAGWAGSGSYGGGSSAASASASQSGWGAAQSSGYGAGSGSYGDHGASTSAKASGNGYASSGYSHGASEKPSATASWSSTSRSPLPPRPSHSANCMPCAGNTASTRNQWCQNDIQTDYYEVHPCTGKTREYFFELTETTLYPDGYPRRVQVINGQIPGPTIEADWGDDVVVHFTNNLPAESHNGSSLHFHGIQQLDTNSADGTTSISQCPTPPGSTYTYRWSATQYGSSWYHSHFGFQAWNGVSGAIVINGPASANYDVDAGPILLSDWNHWTADEIYPLAQVVGPVTELTGLINGKNKWNTSMSSVPTSPGIPGGAPPAGPPPSRKRDAAGNGTVSASFHGNNNATKTSNSSELIGEYYSLKFEAGQSYRLRVVNVAIDSGFKFSIDNHKLTVIATDFVPITPYETDMIFLTMGQRYDVIVKADQTSAKDYWMRAIPQKACSDNSNQLNIKGIVHYGESTAEPTTTAYAYTDECVDEPLASLVPVLAKNAGPADLQTSEAVSVAKNADNFFEWTLNGTSFLVDWNSPALLNVYNNNSAAIKTKSNLIEMPKRGEWIYLLISETGLPVPHPIHLHGHDFYIVGSGNGAYTGLEPLQTVNPPRRDVVNLPGGGWLMLAWKADNPGNWLMHCHIGWHTLEGFALQFLELEDEILSTPGVIDDQLPGNCDAWNRYAAQDDPVQGVDGLVDSGL